jgi:DNA-binding GntR family transcriptional regulator
MTVVKIEKRLQGDNRAISDYAYEKLVGKILRLELSPGAPLVEKHLIDELDIGRTPIREALHRLAGEGLVCREPHRGVFICEATPESVRDICEFRMSVEGHMARLAALRGEEARVEALDRLVKELDGLDPEVEFDRFVAAGRQFYQTMAQAAGNAHYQEMVPRLYNVSMWFLFYAGKTQGDWLELSKDFSSMLGDLVAPISRQRADQAEAIMRLYITNYRDALDNHLGQFWRHTADAT